MKAALLFAVLGSACVTPRATSSSPAPGAAPAAPTSPAAPAEPACPTRLPAWTDRAPPLGSTVDKVCLIGASDDDYLRLHELVAPREGTALALESVRADLEALYALGIVKDAIAIAEPIDSKRLVLTYAVTEFDQLTEVRLEGATAISAEDVQALAHAGLPASPLMRRAVELHLADLYGTLGFARAKVTTTLQKLPAGKASLTVAVEEGPRLLVSAIRFPGAKRVPVPQLQKAIRSAVGAVYSEELVTRDTAAVTALYFDRGMINVRVEPKPPAVAPTDSSVELIFEIEEGDVFRVGKIGLRGIRLGDEKAVLRRLESKPRALFSRSVIQDDMDRLKHAAKERGLDVTVTPATEINLEAKTVDLTFELEQAPPDPTRF